jgi:hypothetical protein
MLKHFRNAPAGLALLSTPVTIPTSMLTVGFYGNGVPLKDAFSYSLGTSLVMTGIVRLQNSSTHKLH